MFNRFSIKNNLIFLSLLCLLPATRKANVDPLPSQFDVIVKTDPSPIAVGTVTLNVTVTPQDKCSEISLTEFKLDNLEYRGNRNIISRISQSNTAEFNITLDITADDTCGIEFTVSGGGFSQEVQAYWVFEGDTVKSYQGNPRLWNFRRYSPNDLSGIEVKNTTRKKTIEHKDRCTTGYPDGNGKLISKEKADRQKAGMGNSLDDSSKDSLRRPPESDSDAKRQSEKKKP